MGSSLVCESRHSFDMARAGYVNLLGRAAPGNADTTQMVAARDRFLGAGHYRPITEAVAALIPDAQRVVEVGAGTGHHLAGVLDQMPRARGLAADVSPAACRRAAKAHPRVASIVADTWAGLPLMENSVDAVLCIFAPRNCSEFARVLSDDGVVVVVLPQPDHLAELRRSHDLLDIGDSKVEKLLDAARGHLDLVSEAPLTTDLVLTQQEATDLVAMGPNAFHSSTAIPATGARSSVTCLTFTKADRRDR